MKVYAQIIVSRDGYVAGVGDDISWVSAQTRAHYTRLIHGMGNCIMGRRAYQSLQNVILSSAKDLNNNKDSSPSRRVEDKSAQNDKKRLFDLLDDPFVVILSQHNYPSQSNRHYTHAKPKNILKLLDEKGYSSTVICGGVQTIQTFVDAELVDRLIVYREDVDVGEGLKFEEKLLEGWECLEENGSKILYTNNDTSSHSG